MAKILKTLAPVDSIQGMIGKRQETVSKKAFIANLRKVGGVKHKGQPFMYFSVRVNDRSTPVSAAEIVARNKFAAVAAEARAIMRDPERGPMLMVQWKLDNLGYPTFYGYCFHIAWEEYAG